MKNSNSRGKDAYSTQAALKRRKLKPIGVIGDVSPVEHGGGVIYEAPNGTYEMHYFSPYEDDDGEELVSIYIFDIAPNVLSELDWVDWKQIAQYIDMPVDELRGYAESTDPLARASVYESVGQYHSFGELDPYQREESVGATDLKYDKDIDKAHAAQSQRRSSNPTSKRSANPGADRSQLEAARRLAKGEAR